MITEVQQALQRITQSGRARLVTTTFFLLWLVGLSGIVLIEPLLGIAAIGASVAVLVLLLFPHWALYLMAVLYPFIHLEFWYGSINVPYVDAVAVVAFAAWSVRVAWQLCVEPRRLRELRFPLIAAFVPFALVALVSVFMSWNPLETVQYFLRPLLFFYLVFVLYVVNFLKKPRVLLRVLGLMFWVGVAIAVYGLYGYMTVNVPTFLDRRVTPLPLFGMSPLGGNHNLVADIMVTTIPIGFFFMMTAKSELRQKLLFLVVLFLTGVAILTFSRSGWLALLLELALLAVLQYREHLHVLLRYTAGILFILSPLVVGLFFFLGNDTYSSSNENRILLNEVAVEMVQDSPIVGVGPGTFQTVLETNRIYIEEFGAPLDAHGFIQKVGSELGVLGLVSYVGMLALTFRQLAVAYRRAKRYEPWAYLMLTLVLMVSGAVFFQLFQTSYFVAKLWLPIGVALAATYMINTKSEMESHG